MAHSIVHVAIGSSLGDRTAHIAVGVAGLKHHSELALLRASRLFETAPVGGVAQRRFLNGVLELGVAEDLSPLTLLEWLLASEGAAGRSRTLRWEDRTLDLDLVLWGDRVVDHPRLQVPHPQLHRRRFVLQPLADLVPDAPLPGLDGTVSEYLARVSDPPEDCVPIPSSEYPANWPT